MPLKRVRPGTRKAMIQAEWLANGSDAARALNATLDQPIAESSLRSWFATWNRELKGRSPGNEGTAFLRAEGLRLAGARKLPGRAQLAELPDQRVVKIRTAMNRCLICQAGNLYEHNPAAVLISIPTTADTLED